MKQVLTLPHRVCESTCYVNGLDDILEWRGQRYMDYLLSIVGGMAEFAYLKFKVAKPPCLVYWGASPKHLLKDLGEIIGFRQTLIENKSFKTTFAQLKEFISNEQPVLAGALDMYFLHFYRDIYQKIHIPIHYVLVTGFDDEAGEVYLHDCSHPGVQKITHDDFEKALNVQVPGMSKKNTLRAFLLPKVLPSELEIARKGLGFRANKMLHPPVKMFGLPAMRKLAKEIFDWKNKGCFEHLVTYATSPPQLPKSFEKSDGMRFWKAQVLRALGEKYRVEKWTRAAALFETSGQLIISLCEAAMRRDRKAISQLISSIADAEEQAYIMLQTNS